jgi:hypothetical protein
MYHNVTLESESDHEIYEIFFDTTKNCPQEQQHDTGNGIFKIMNGMGCLI